MTRSTNFIVKRHSFTRTLSLTIALQGLINMGVNENMSFTFEVLRLDGLAGVDEPALVRPARHVTKVLPEVGEAGGAAREHRIGHFEVLFHVADLEGAIVNVVSVSRILFEFFGYRHYNLQVMQIYALRSMSNMGQRGIQLARSLRMLTSCGP